MLRSNQSIPREAFGRNIGGDQRMSAGFDLLLVPFGHPDGYSAQTVCLAPGNVRRLPLLYRLSQHVTPSVSTHVLARRICLVNILGYNSSKTALNAVTVAFAKELAASRITVNAADPGYTATDFNGHTGYRTVEQAAAGIVWLATRNTRNMTGGFYFEQNEVPW